MFSFSNIIMTQKKYKKQSSEQKRHNRLCAEWIKMDFVPLSVVNDRGFNNVIQNGNPRLNKINNNTATRELKNWQQR